MSNMYLFSALLSSVPASFPLWHYPHGYKDGPQEYTYQFSNPGANDPVFSLVPQSL